MNMAEHNDFASNTRLMNSNCRKFDNMEDAEKRLRS